MTLRIRKLANALGAEITGIDISKPLDDGAFGEIYSAFLEHLVLVFRGQPLTQEQHVAFSRRFGDLEKNEGNSSARRAPEFPEILLVISKPKPNGEAATGRYSGQDWHSDRSHFAAPAQASLLRGVVIPPIGGDTMFCNLYQAYETLSNGMKNLLSGLHGVHVEDKDVNDYSAPGRYAPKQRSLAAAHPIVRVHPDTGRKALYVHGKVRLFVGMTTEESKPLIQYLTQHAVRPQGIYRHRWQKDDLVIWDNRCLLHIALSDYDRTQVRHMERTTVNGTVSGYAYDGPLE